MLNFFVELNALVCVDSMNGVADKLVDVGSLIDF